ncbi:MAG: hypothetical protein EZS28_008820 [Streblomastix strix]|uniref:WASH complex subunit CCDC53 n=1 Tax=Streblomastix strix TaxID=222440 RepID=A0A5J4WLA7_9EUKA|nr:MAG: hypothetical protein EZS28_008820 [Streblomastix strix]
MTVPNLDASKLEPASVERILIDFNLFIINSVHHLNKFVGMCEVKLAENHEKLGRLRALVANLEKKLSSIPDSSLVYQAPIQSIDPVQLQSIPLPVGTIPLPPPLPQQPQINQQQQQQIEQPIEQPKDDDPYPLVFEKKYKLLYSLLKVGVHEENVKQKGRTFGLDEDDVIEFIRQFRSKFQGKKAPTHPLDEQQQEQDKQKDDEEEEEDDDEEEEEEN